MENTDVLRQPGLDNINIFKKDISRLIRRSEISRHPNLDLSEVKNLVRDYEDKIGVVDLVNTLVSKEFLISPRMYQIGQKVSEFVISNFIYVDSIVLMGGSVSGGRAIREAVGSDLQADFDWGIIYNGDKPKKDDLEKLYEAVRSKIPIFGHEVGYTYDVAECSGINPKYYLMPAIITSKDAEEILYSLADRKLSVWEFGMYFDPSCPEESNERNRKKLLLELASIDKKYPKTWEAIVNKVLKSWEDIHRVSYGHLKHGGQHHRDRDIADRVRTSSGSVMATAMRELLGSTRAK